MKASSRSLSAAAAAAVLCAAPGALAQSMAAAPVSPRLQLAAFTGWQVNSDVDVSAGELVVDDAQSFGAALWFAARPGTKVELLWLYSSPEARLESHSAGFQSSRPFEVGMNYFQLGGLQSIRRGALEPFAGATVGAAWYSPGRLEATNGSTSVDLEDTWRLAFTLGGGLNAFVTPKLAIRLHARMILPVYIDGGAFYAGSGGSGLAVSGWIPMVQGDFGVGLVFAQ